MLILSIDVGIKNLACCMVDASSNKITYWDNINLCGDKEIPCNYCKAPAKYSKSNDFYCKKHAKQYSTYLIPEINIQNLNKIKKPQLLETYKKCLAVSNQQKDDNTIKKCKKTDLEDGIKNIYDAHYLNHIYKTKAHDFDLITLGRNINSIFNNLFKEMNISADNLKKVIIENQISPIANRMKSIQGMLTQYFITKDIEYIEYISAANKLNQFTKEPTEYSERKKASIKITFDLLKESNTDWCTHFEKHKKKDDLADCYLQLLWFIKNRNI